MKSICIYHHQGLGDHISCNGMVRYILKKENFDKVYVFAKYNYFYMIEYMYRDEDKIEVLKFDQSKNEAEEVFILGEQIKPTFFLRIGFDKLPANYLSINKNCWEYFYEQVQVPLTVRNDYFYVERDKLSEDALLKELNPHNKPYIFVHDEPTMGYNIEKSKISKDLPIIRNDNTKNLFHFIKVLEEAEEVHCMESSFKCLVDLCSTKGELFYHDFRKDPFGKAQRDWTIIRYGDK